MFVLLALHAVAATVALAGPRRWPLLGVALGLTVFATTAIASAVLGGAYIWVGPIVGAFLYTAIPEILEPFLGASKNIVNGILLVIIMVFRQRGLIDPRQFRNWADKRKQKALAKS